jgi:hypothetical protein
MDEIKNGGPAFPTKHPAQDPRASGFYTEDGMTLRDYFAAKAMQSFISASQSGTAFGVSADGLQNCANVAIVSYTMADAMLRAREANHG